VHEAEGALRIRMPLRRRETIQPPRPMHIWKRPEGSKEFLRVNILAKSGDQKSPKSSQTLI
jgi:hypothetical protein